MQSISPSASIVVGLSGGVDSSVAAFLLKEAGFKISGMFMKNWEENDTNCSIHQDLKDAENVCENLGIDLQLVNFADSYWQHVFTYFLDEYKAGRTPNPDILCNKEIKFKAFLDYAKAKGADYIATGHYAQIVKKDQHMILKKGIDPAKDQSYFLHALNQSQLKHSIFPVGHLLKNDVRAIAKKIGLKNHNKKDSTGICFIGEKKFKNFLTEYLPNKPGKIVSLEGEILGKHDGLMFYTIGQRQGLEIGGKKGKAEAPWYVVKKDLPANILVVAQGTQHPALFKKKLYVKEIHWINPTLPLPTTLSAKIRYRQKNQACKLINIHSDLHEIHFDEPQRAITEGQSIVFYDDDICLGGGIIESSSD